MIPLLEVAALLLLSGPGEGVASRPARFSLDDPAESDFSRRVGEAGDEEGEARPAQQEDPKPQRPEGPVDSASQEPGPVDFDWLELYPRAGIAMFSGKYHISAKPCIEVEVRAPLTFLSPASNPQGDYFGVFAQINGALIRRTIVPTLATPSGIMASLAIGMDYTVIRDNTWLVMVRLGVQYTYYGGVTDLKDGLQAVGGLTAGISVSRSLMITLTPEIVYAKTGDYILLGMLGAAVQF